MKTKVKVYSIYHCSLERAFKTPLLCDVKKVHTGYLLMPKVIFCTEDTNWGQPGASKKVFVAKSLTQKGGFASIDYLIERVENKYWKFEVKDFQLWMLGLSKLVGEWETNEIKPNEVMVQYTYTMHSKNFFLYPFDWLFAKTFWRIYMKRVLKNVKHMAYQQEPYLFA